MGTWNLLRAACRVTSNKPPSLRCRQLRAASVRKAASAGLCGVVTGVFAVSSHAGWPNGQPIGITAAVTHVTCPTGTPPAINGQPVGTAAAVTADITAPRVAGMSAASRHAGWSVGVPVGPAAVTAHVTAPQAGAADLAITATVTGAGATRPRAPQTDPLRIAVAANFRGPLNQLAEEFKRAHGVGLSPTFGASGLLAAQIRQGAPFDAFFSADTLRPQALVADGLAAAPVTIYARGRVALKLPGPNSTGPSAASRRIGIPNPELAPYGAAAVQCLQRLGVWQHVRHRLVYGNNVNQVDHFLASGALHQGFLALSQLVARNTAPERYWVCPSDFHAPINQGAVVLNRSRNPPAARALLGFMTQSTTQARLRQLGYADSD